MYDITPLRRSKLSRKKLEVQAIKLEGAKTGMT